MSGIYIPGMEMPKRCNECRFLEGDNMDGLCHAADRWMDDEEWTWYVYEEDDIDTDKPANCPLIAVPDHGRLIDADAIDWVEGRDEQDRPVYLLLKAQIDGIPTIIPEEKEGK